jgi:hypothetical protein
MFVDLLVWIGKVTVVIGFLHNFGRPQQQIGFLTLDKLKLKDYLYHTL